MFAYPPPPSAARAATVPATPATASTPAAGVAVTTPTRAEPGEPGAALSEAEVPGGGVRVGGGAVGRQRVSRRTGRPGPEGPG